MLRVAHLISDLAAFVADGFSTVTREQYAERLKICQLCRKRVGRKCGICGCYIGVKARGRAWQCPDNPPKWLALGDPPHVS